LNIGKVWGSFENPITGEKIEIRTIQDVRYVKYRMNRLKKEYPENFKKTKHSERPRGNE